MTPKEMVEKAERIHVNSESASTSIHSMRAVTEANYWLLRAICAKIGADKESDGEK